MNFLKKLFAGGGSGSSDRGIYFYVQPKACKEILKVRVDPMNEISQSEDGKGYYTRKLVSGHRCPFQAELEIYFDKNRNVTNTDVTNGKIVTEAEWLAQQEPATDT